VPRQNTDLLQDQAHEQDDESAQVSRKTGLMLRWLRIFVVLLARCFSSHRDLMLKNLALLQQLSVLKRRRPQSRFALPDKFFGVILRLFWHEWKRLLIFVKPETVVRWHRAGFKMH
jgi:hypothetical protein